MSSEPNASRAGREPDAPLDIPGRPLIVPIRPPAQVGGFRFAVTADGANDDGTPRVSAERGYVTDPAERERLLGFLTSGANVVQTMRYAPDGFDRSRTRAVPVGYRTDGSWVWPASVEYYLREHSVAPEPDLYRHIAAHGYRCPAVPDDVVRRARQAVEERFRVRRERKRAYLADRGLLVTRTGDRTRFPERVDRELRAAGWYSGRDVHERVDGWLARALPEAADAAFERDGYPRYRPTPAARRVLDEFGGIGFAGGGRGVSMATTPFVIYPTDGEDDLDGFLFKIQNLALHLGRPLFQVGEVERGTGALAVDADGRVFTCGPVDRFAGRDIDEALRYMILGIAGPYPGEVAV